MTAVLDLLEAAKKGSGLPSDNVLAQRLGVTRATVSGWRTGAAPMPDERIAQVCAVGKLDGPTWVAMIHAEKAQSATERALWRLMLDRLSAVAAVIALVCVSVPGIADAKASEINGLRAQTAHILYIMYDAGVPGGQCQGPSPSSRPRLWPYPTVSLASAPPTASILRRSARLSHPDLTSVTAVLEPGNIGSILRARSAGTWPAPQQPGQNQAAHTRFNPTARDASRK